MNFGFWKNVWQLLTNLMLYIIFIDSFLQHCRDASNLIFSMRFYPFYDGYRMASALSIQKKSGQNPCWHVGNWKDKKRNTGLFLRKKVAQNGSVDDIDIKIYAVFFLFFVMIFHATMQFHRVKKHFAIFALVLWKFQSFTSAMYVNIFILCK